MIASLCHDLDHAGVTNNFLDSTKDDLAYLYQHSILENHHYYVTMLILDNYKILLHLSKEDYEILKKEIREAIIATDLLVYFTNKVEIEQICKRKAFCWENNEHRRYLKGIMMIAADLSGVCKPFLISKRITDNLYGSLYMV